MVTGARGRAFSLVRVPQLVLAYLSGEPFPAVRPAPDVETPRASIDPQRGDDIASIHRHVKWRIEELDPGYHWPRYHSFTQFMRHLLKLELVEKTGERETSELTVQYGDPPVQAGEVRLRLDPALGFQQRSYYRLTPGSTTDPAWQNPMAAIYTLYGIPETRPKVPRLRPPGRPARRRAPVAPEEAPPEAAPAPEAPPRRRGRRLTPAPVEAAPPPVPAELAQLQERLDLRRRGLQDQARAVAQLGETPEGFDDLHRMLMEYLAELRAHYRPTPLPRVVDLLPLLATCVEAWRRAATGPARRSAQGSCRRASQLIAEELAYPLPVPRRL